MIFEAAARDHLQALAEGSDRLEADMVKRLKSKGFKAMLGALKKISESNPRLAAVTLHKIMGVKGMLSMMERMRAKRWLDSIHGTY